MHNVVVGLALVVTFGLLFWGHRDTRKRATTSKRKVRHIVAESRLVTSADHKDKATQKKRLAKRRRETQARIRAHKAETERQLAMINSLLT